MVVAGTLACCRVMLEVMGLPVWLALLVQPYHSFAFGTERSLLVPFNCLICGNWLSRIEMQQSVFHLRFAILGYFALRAG